MLQPTKWNAAELAGGDERQSKFLRLLGAKNVKDIVAAGKPPASTSIKQRDQELEKQFNQGIKMKNEPNGKRRGLGA